MKGALENEKIGLVGGTGPQSTLIYYKELNRRINERSGGTEKVHTPFISIPETAAEYAASKGYHRVGLLGTIFTMEKDYLSKAFISRGIEVIVPDPDKRVYGKRKEALFPIHIPKFRRRAIFYDLKHTDKG